MYSYILRRLLLMIPTLIGVVTITFIISEYVPGGPKDQIRAMLMGEHEGGSAGGEVSGASGAGHKEKKKLGTKAELQIIRTYDLNHSAFERYLRTFIWYGKNSVLSTIEVDENDSAKFGDHYIMVQLNNAYYAYDNLWETVDQENKRRIGEIYYDQESQNLKSTISNHVFDVQTGASLSGSDQRSLTSIPLEFEDATHINDEGKRIPYQEIYIKESFWQSVTNWNNWHGFFLLKFGESIHHSKNIIALIGDRLPISMSLGIFSFLATYSVCIILGIAKAVRNGETFDTLTSAIILFGFSVPGFVLAVMFIVFLGPGDQSLWDIVPSDGDLFGSGKNYSFWEGIGNYFHHLWAPMICLMIGSFAILTILTKNSVLDHIHQLYATAARARGLSEKKVLYKHVLRNALIPLITGFPSSFLAMFFAGSMLIEKIFNIHGLGLLGYEAVINRDFPLVMGSLFIFTIMGLIGKLLTDICYVIVDPRISFDKSSA